MPAKSKSQQRLFQAAAHGATFAKAEKIRASMSASKMREFETGSEKGKPEHVKRKAHPTTPHPGGYGARMARRG